MDHKIQNRDFFVDIKPTDVQLVCRICLAVDCKLFPMNNQLEEAYESLTGIQLDEDSFPEYACFECAQRLLNSFKFRHKCINTHLLLKDLATTEMVDYLSLSSIQSINRELHHLNSALTYTDVLLFDSWSYSSGPCNKATLDITGDVIEINDDEQEDQQEEFMLEFHEEVHSAEENSDQRAPDLAETDTIDYDGYPDSDEKDSVSKNNSLSTEIVQPENNIPCNSRGKPYRFTCDICGKKFTIKATLNSHKIKIHKILFKCNFCEKEFTKKSVLHKHTILVHNCETFNCDKCNKKFSRSKQFKKHRCYKERLLKPTVCSKCGKTCTIGTLNNHMASHITDRKHTCNKCGKKFTHLHTLKKHLQTHTKRKPFTCEECGKNFTCSNHLRRHARLHTDAKRYACDVCGKQCTQLGNLRIHMRIHTGEKPYSCDICNQKFTYSTELNRHLKTHSTKERFSCDVCMAEFKQKSILDRHKSVRHSFVI